VVPSTIDATIDVEKQTGICCINKVKRTHNGEVIVALCLCSEMGVDDGI
jgi:hypothetical protein